jgi:hypothetical protein
MLENIIECSSSSITSCVTVHDIITYAQGIGFYLYSIIAVQQILIGACTLGPCAVL